jgi:hypothetical protein
VGIFGTDEGTGPEKPASVFSTYAKAIDTTSSTQCPTTVIVSTDPISAEMQAIKILRMNKSKQYDLASMPPYLKSCAGIDVAGLSPTYDLGVIDETKMEIRRIVNGQVMAVKSPSARLAAGVGAAVWARQVKGHSTFVDFALPKEHIGKEAVLEVFNARGGLTRTFSQKVLGIRNHLSWDERDGSGTVAAAGMYLIKLTCGSLRDASQFSIVR